MKTKITSAIDGHRHGRVPRSLREQQLLDVAERIFASEGYQGASIDGIAADAGVTRPMVYNYFQSKEGIYLACLRRARGRLDAELAQAAASASGLMALVANCADAYLTFVERNQGSWEVLFGGGAAIAGPATAEARELRFKTIRLLAALLKQGGAGASDQALEAFANMLSGAGEQMAKWWRSECPTVERSQILDYYMTLVGPGIEALLHSTDQP